MRVGAGAERYHVFRERRLWYATHCTVCVGSTSACVRPAGEGSWRVPRLLAYQMAGRHLGGVRSFRRASSGGLRPLEPRFLRYRWRVPVVCPAAVPLRFERRAVRQSSGRERADLGVDSLEVGSRRLQLWRVRRLDPNHHDLLWERPIPGRASDDGLVPRGGRRGARSYWARHRNCVVVSDGGSRLLWVVDLSTLKTDSIALPEWEIPAFGELPSDRQVLNFGGRDLQTPQEPGLLSRWTGLIVDPDGHAWLRAWTESREEFQVFVVSLASGASRRLSPPGFPTAFGVPGVFYTARARPETDEHQIVRFKAERQ